MNLLKLFRAIEMTESDMTIIALSYSLVYTYYWINVSDTIYSEVETAYVNTSTENAYDEYEEFEEEGDGAAVKFDVERETPYDPIGIIGPLLGVTIKSLFVAFILFLLVNAIVFGSMACGQLDYSQDHLDTTIKKALRMKEAHAEPEPAESANDFNAFTKSDPNLNQNIVKTQAYKDLYTYKTEFGQVHIGETERTLKFIDTSAMFLKLQLYWLFFVVNLHIIIVALTLCVFLTLLYIKLIIPHVKGIRSDVTQMKCQIQIILLMNYVIFVSTIWYMAFKTL